jgi:Tannase and feruloyl esterase
MEPGAFHCGGGQGFYAFDALSTMVDWVENGKAPDSIVAAHLDAKGKVDGPARYAPIRRWQSTRVRAALTKPRISRVPFPEETGTAGGKAKVGLRSGFSLKLR